MFFPRRVININQYTQKVGSILIYFLSEKNVAGMRHSMVEPLLMRALIMDGFKSIE